MYIDSPSFVHRRIVNNGLMGSARNKDEFYEFGKEREQLVAHVTSTLLDHTKNEQILERFRREAEMAKKRKYQAKRINKNSSDFTQPDIYQRPSPKHCKTQQKQATIQADTSRTDNYPPKSPQFEVVLRHSNDLVNRYRIMLNLKEKELKKKDRKLEHSIMAMHKLSQKIRHLQREKELSNREEQLEFSKIQVTLKQLSTQLAQNKDKVNHQLSSIKDQAKPSTELPPLNQSNLSKSKQNRQSDRPKVPKGQQLQRIKRKARSLKSKNSNTDILKSPSVFYTNKSVDKSQRTSLDRSEYLDRLNRSIVHQSRYRMISVE